MIGTEYESAAVQAVLGVGHSPMIPDVLWLGWLDASLDLVAMSGLTVPHAVFEGVSGGVSNTELIDAGVAPADIGDVDFVALFDAETGGEIVAYAAVTFAEAPSEGDPLGFEPGGLTFTYEAP